MIRRPPRSTLSSSSAASDVYKRQIWCRLQMHHSRWKPHVCFWHLTDNRGTATFCPLLEYRRFQDGRPGAVIPWEGRKCADQAIRCRPGLANNSTLGEKGPLLNSKEATGYHRTVRPTAMR